MQEHYPEIDVDELARELNKLLPASFPLSRDELARLVRQCSLKRELSAAETGQLGQLQHELDGKPIQLSNAHIVFGSENSIGDVEVGDVATGNIYKDTVIINIQELDILVELKPSHHRIDVLIDTLTEDFVGRKFIFDEIYTQLNNPAFPSGYIQIIGAPGIGKSALLAKLVKDNHYIFHFNNRLEGVVSREAFLKNVCTQLIDRYALPYKALPTKAFQDNELLFELLVEAKKQLKSEPLVLIIDALDESEPPSNGGNPLYLPKTLPQGVFIIVTTRPKVENMLDSTTLYNISFERIDVSQLNREDARSYIERFLEDSRYYQTMITRLIEWGLDKHDFTEIVLDASEGNFLYLKLALNDIYSDLLKPENIVVSKGKRREYKLPRGLAGYYEKHWDLVKNTTEDFDKYDSKVIYQIGAAHKPVPFNILQRAVDLQPTEVKRVIRKWRQFLVVIPNSKGLLCYKIFHQSFFDYLQDQHISGIVNAKRSYGKDALSLIMDLLS